MSAEGWGGPQAEADSYWCLCKLLDGIQDHYTYAQPGIQRTVFHLKELVRRIDEPVARHLDDEAVDFLQFSFRRAPPAPSIPSSWPLSCNNQLSAVFFRASGQFLQILSTSCRPSLADEPDDWGIMQCQCWRARPLVPYAVGFSIGCAL